MTAVSVHVVTVDSDGEILADRLAEGGLTVSGPVAETLDDLEAAIRNAPGADAVCVCGNFGAHSELADFLGDLVEHPLPGYGEALRRAWYATDPPRALRSRVFGGLLLGRFVFAVPRELPEVGGELVVSALNGIEGTTDEKPAPIPFGGARGASVGLAVSENREPEPVTRDQSRDEEAEATPPGWKRAVEMLDAEILPGRREDLPEAIEKLAPVLNVLHTAGESGTLRLPSGRRYSLWGWPDLQRPTSKVLAVSWGEPLAEVVALHRHPAEAGTCIEEGNGLLPSAGADIGEVCKRVCGRAPPDTDGQLFAISAESVWILRSRRVFKWDGSREKDDGNPKQVLASLVLQWSNR